ncbi:hypothetical protein [Ornithinimicrobium kibberense]|uniref:hypothetical protein n=1 Tax=Ornithinimicrobium kibberense TaxID=282060 RepID=UPI0036113E50
MPCVRAQEEGGQLGRRGHRPLRRRLGAQLGQDHRSLPVGPGGRHLVEGPEKLRAVTVDLDGHRHPQGEGTTPRPRGVQRGLHGHHLHGCDVPQEVDGVEKVLDRGARAGDHGHRHRFRELGTGGGLPQLRGVPGADEQETQQVCIPSAAQPQVLLPGPGDGGVPGREHRGVVHESAEQVPGCRPR